MYRCLCRVRIKAERKVKINKKMNLKGVTSSHCKQIEQHGNTGKLRIRELQRKSEQ